MSGAVGSGHFCFIGVDVNGYFPKSEPFYAVVQTTNGCQIDNSPEK